MSSPMITRKTKKPHPEKQVFLIIESQKQKDISPKNKTQTTFCNSPVDNLGCV